MSSCEVRLSTITPIWTGGVDGKVDRLHATGVIGSLRWWYEALVRGLGGWACDPTGHSCLYDRRKSGGGVCDACRVFGTTGWARRFRLVVAEGSSLRADGMPGPIAASRSYTDARGQTKIPKWYLNSAPLSGQTVIRATSTDQEFRVEIVSGLIQFLADWAALGARPQMGLGVVELTPRQDTRALHEYLQAISGSRPDEGLPSLRNLFFARVTANGAAQNENFNLKYDLRRLFAADAPLRHRVMGSARGDREGAKVAISRPYDGGKLRIWGWMPEATGSATSRDQVVQAIHAHLRGAYTIGYWREFNSARDTTGRYNHPSDFLDSLLVHP